MMNNYGAPWWSYLPIGSGVYREQQAVKGKEKAETGKAKAEQKQAEQKTAEKEARDRYTQYMADLERRKVEQASREQQADLARKFEKETREDIGMSSDALDVLHDQQAQLAQEQLDTVVENIDTLQQGGVADLKVPWKAIGLLGVASLGVWYWRK